MRGLTGKPNATQLARQWGWDRSKVRRRLVAWQAAGHLPKARRRSTSPATTMATTAPTTIATTQPTTNGDHCADHSTDHRGDQSGDHTVATADRPPASGTAQVVGRPPMHEAPSIVPEATAPTTGHVAASTGRSGAWATGAVTFLAATFLAGISGYFSVAGMSTLFAGAATAAVVMGGALEFAKLVGASWLSRSWSTAFPALRWAILAMVVALMGLNAMGCYGYLTRAHLQSRLAGQIDVESRATPIAQQIENKTAIVTDLNRRIGQIDSAVEEATRRGRTKNAMDLVAQQTRKRTDLLTQRQKRVVPLLCDLRQVTSGSSVPTQHHIAILRRSSVGARPDGANGVCAGTAAWGRIARTGRIWRFG